MNSATEQRSSASVSIDKPMTEWPTSLLGRLPIVQTDVASSARGFIAHALGSRGAARRPFYSTSANGQVLALCGKDEAFLSLMCKADQIHADGMPMVLYSKLFSKRPLAERVATTDLVHEVAKLAEDAGVSFYFLGASEEVNAKAVEEMQRRYPKLIFAGRRNGYFSRDEEEAVIAGISAARPDILWIGLGVPLEQQFIERNIGRLTGVGVIKTSGGLFDFISGKNARAPAWMQAAGLEWLYRVWLEPRRLAMRYLTTNPQAIGALIRHSA